MLRVILGALLGYAFIGLLIFATDQFYAKQFDLHTPPAAYYQLAMLTDTIFTFAGGWLCGLISRGDSRALWGLILMGELMGVASTAYLWHTAPHYYSFYLLVMYPPAVWFGAKITKPVAA
jgi:hypothetical protein